MDTDTLQSATPRRRRWFQFRLRTLFVVTTLIGCWLGYEMNLIRQRHGLIARELAIVSAAQAQGMPMREFYFYLACADSAHSPGLLWLFGESGTVGLAILVESVTRERLTPRERARIYAARRLFPEAHIVVVSWKVGSQLHAIDPTD
jgi:hypothetical protein